VSRKKAVVTVVLLCAMMAVMASWAGPGAKRAIERPGVRLVCEEDVDEPLCETIADVVSVAKDAFDGLFPERVRPEIRIAVSHGVTFCEYTVTDRRDTIYVRMGERGLGEWRRPDAGPIGLLCEAVAELHNPQHLAGFNRFIAHRYLVPAVVDQMGVDAIVRTHLAPLAEDGPPTLEAMAHPEYASVHPDYAAVAALMAIEDDLQFDGLRALLDATPQGTADPFAGLREAAIEKAPALADGFTLYDQANELWLEDDGTCLVASFEPGEVIEKVGTLRPHSFVEGLLVAGPGFEVSPSDEWSTHGTHSLKAEAVRPSELMSIYTSDPDWKLKDWRRFSKLEMDLMLEGGGDRRITVTVQDHVAGAHGSVVMFSGTVLPGESRHISYPLTAASLRGDAYWNAKYFSGRFRADEVSRFLISVQGPTEPFTLYLDNIRLTPRAEGDVRDAEAEPAAGRGERPLPAGAAFFSFRSPAGGEPTSGVPEGLWRMLRGGPQRTGQGAGSGATGTLLWEFDTGIDRLVTSPTIGLDGTLYVGCHDHNVYALDGTTGQKRWAFSTSEQVTSTPAVGPDGTVYVGSWDWNVYALDGATGAKKWEFRADGQVANSAAIAEDGTLYISGGGTLYALDSATGEQIWATQQDSILFGSPALSVDGRLVYAGLCYHPNSGLYALNAKTGEREWWFPTEHDESSTPAVGPDGTVYFGSGDDRVYAVDGATGEMKWEFITGRDACSPSIGPDGTVYVWSWDYRLYAIDGATGEGLAEFRTQIDSRRAASTTIASDGTVYLACERLYALDSTLQPRWEFGDGDNALCSPTIGLDGTVYAGSARGKVYAIR